MLFYAWDICLGFFNTYFLLPYVEIFNPRKLLPITITEMVFRHTDITCWDNVIFVICCIVGICGIVF